MRLRAVAAVALAAVSAVLVAPAAVAADIVSSDAAAVRQFLQSSEYGKSYAGSKAAAWFETISNDYDVYSDDYANELYDLTNPSESRFSGCLQSAGYEKLAQLRCPGMWVKDGGAWSWIDQRTVLRAYAKSWQNHELYRAQMSQPYETVVRGDGTTDQRRISVVQSQTYQPKPLDDAAETLANNSGGKVKAATVKASQRVGGLYGSARQKINKVGGKVTKAVDAAGGAAADLFFIGQVLPVVVGGVLNFEYLGENNLGDAEYFCSTVGDDALGGFMSWLSNKSADCAAIQSALKESAVNADITEVFATLPKIETPFGGATMTSVYTESTTTMQVLKIDNDWTGSMCMSSVSDVNCWFGYPILTLEGHTLAAQGTWAGDDGIGSNGLMANMDPTFVKWESASPYTSTVGTIWSPKDFGVAASKLMSLIPAYKYWYYVDEAGQKHCSDGSVVSKNGSCSDPQTIAAVPADQDPERAWESCVTYADGAEVCSTSPDTFKETDGAYPLPGTGADDLGTAQDHGGVTGVTVNEVNTDTGQRTPALQQSADDDYSAFLQDWPDCSDGSCVLDLVQKATETSCYALGDQCTAWYQSTSKDTDYECRYGGVNIGLAACTALQNAFKAETQLSGETVTDPDTGQSVGQVEPSKEETEPAEACWSEKWSDSKDPISYVFKPVKCALVWAFQPSNEQAAKLTDGVSALAATVPAIAATKSMFDGLAASVDMNGCSGLTLDLTAINASFPEFPNVLASCDGDALHSARIAVNTLLKALLLWATVTGVARQVGSIVGYEARPGGDGQMEVRS